MEWESSMRIQARFRGNKARVHVKEMQAAEQNRVEELKAARKLPAAPEHQLFLPLPTMPEAGSVSELQVPASVHTFQRYRASLNVLIAQAQESDSEDETDVDEETWGRCPHPEDPYHIPTASIVCQDVQPSQQLKASGWRTDESQSQFSVPSTNQASYLHQDLVPMEQEVAARQAQAETGEEHKQALLRQLSKPTRSEGSCGMGSAPPLADGRRDRGTATQETLSSALQSEKARDRPSPSNRTQLIRPMVQPRRTPEFLSEAFEASYVRPKPTRKAPRIGARTQSRMSPRGRTSRTPPRDASYKQPAFARLREPPHCQLAPGQLLSALKRQVSNLARDMDMVPQCTRLIVPARQGSAPGFCQPPYRVGCR